MTESTQLQTAENNNAGVVKMEPPPPSSASTSSTVHANSTSPAPMAAMEQLSAHQQQQYALKWNDFQASILNSFRHLRDEEDFVDVTLACDQRSFTAHKVVLSACSPYFRKLLKANPCEHPIVILRDVSSDDVQNLLSFMYNGEVNVSHEHLPEFLKTAHLLQIRGLADVSGGYTGANAAAALNNANKSLTAALTNNKNNNNNTSSTNNNNNNKMSFLTGSQNSNSNMSLPFTTPSSLAAAAAMVSSTAAINLPNNNNSASSNNNNNSTNNNSGSSSSHTPAIQELKASSASPGTHHWDLADMDNNRNSHLTPPPQKRIKSADLFRAQHGISPERLLLDREFPVAGQHPLTRERNRDRSRDTSRDRDRNMELRESLLGQALENSNGQQHSGNQKPHPDLASLHAQSAGEDSNSSDTEPSDRGDAQHDGTMDSMNGSIDNQRSHSFPSAFLGLQGLPGLLPGPSGIGANDFVTRRSLEMRVRATDPRPCPKCGKIYRSAHTLRTHLEDKHTVCPGYRCVLCGTVAKSRNSLHSHMSRQHRGISTKDLPVLPMPSAFDPELASRLLAKAGVKISPAELRARASPTSGGGGNASGGSSQPKLEMNSNASRGEHDDMDDSDDDPEDLTTGSGGGYGAVGGSNSSANDLSRYHESLLSNFGHANTSISIRAALSQQQKDMASAQMPANSAAGQSLLDTYLQFITENSFGMSMSQEHAAAAALHAAKMAQLNAMGHGLDKLPSGLLPPQFDLGKIAGLPGAGYGGGGGGGSNSSLTIEPIMRRDQPSSLVSPNENGPVSLSGAQAGNNSSVSTAADIRRDSSEPMDLGLDNNQSGSINEANNSEGEENYSEDEGVHNT